MDRLRRLEVFVQVAESSSFSAAARALGLAQSQVSRAVRDLEQQLGCSLFARSTRRVVLSSEGTLYLDRVRSALHEFAAADEAVLSARSDVRGTLRVTAPVAFGDTLAPILVELAARYPALVIESELTDRTVDIVKERFDVAVRSGPVRSSSLRVKKLGTIDSVLVASPSYLARRGVPRKADDLRAHEHVSFTVKTAPLRLRDSNGRVSSVRLNGRIRTNQLRVVQLSVLAGAGIAVLPLPLARPGLEDGRLQRVLPTMTVGGASLYALFAPQERTSARVRVFLDAVTVRAPGRSTP